MTRTKWFVAPLLAALMCCAVRAGDGPPLELPNEIVPVDGYARFTPKASDGSKIVSVTYVSLDGARPFPSEELKDVRRLLVPVDNLKPGVYRFVVIASNDKGDQTRGQISVRVGTDPGPAPGPGPGPGPNPAPTPSDPTTLTILIIEPDNSALLSRGQMLADPALNARVKEKGHRFRNVTKSVTDQSGNVPADVAPYLKRAGDKMFAFPAVFMIDPKGVVRFEGALPTTYTAADLLAQIQKIGG